MPLRQPPANEQSRPSRFEGPFVGRTEDLCAFVDAIEAQDSDDYSVLVYHGIGGIGKTRLAHELSEILEGTSSKAEEIDRISDLAPPSQFCWARIDFEVSRRRKPALGLYHLRTQLSGKYGFHFPTFDLAFAQYWLKAYPESPLPNPDSSFLEEHGDFALALLDAVGDIPVAGLLAKIPKHVDRLGKEAMNLYRKRNEEALQGVSALPAHEIEEYLPRLWTYDFKNQIGKSERRSVLFFDTYEALREGQSDESKRHQADWWIRKFVKRLPGTLIVVTGHERLYWPEVTKDWESVLQQRRVQELTPSHARSFLKASGIEEEPIRDHIVETVSGIPFDWVWAVELYREIRREDEEPAPEDFGGTPWELHRRFFRYLQDDEMAMLELLAVPRTFNRTIVEALAENFDPGFPVGQFSRLKRFAFINQVAEGEEGEVMYALHDRARDAIRDHGPFLPGEEGVHEFLFKHHAETLADLRSREIEPHHEHSLQEAFYHGQRSLNAEALGEWFFETEPVFNQAARWQMLGALYEKLVSLQKAALGGRHPHVATTLHNLGVLYEKQGRYEDAESRYDRALEIRESTLGEEHLRAAETLTSLGVLRRKQGRYEDAESRYDRALEIRESALGEEHLQVSETLNNLAVLYWAQGRYEEAEPIFERALEIRESALGEEHPRVATTLNNFGLVYREQGKYEDAQSRFERALEIRELALGEEHPRVATTLHNLGLTYQAQGRHECAEQYFERALDIEESAYREKHPRIATTLNNLAVLYREQGRYEDAESLFNRTLEIRNSSLRKDHPRIAETKKELALLHEEQNERKDAVQLLDQALEIAEQELGQSHPETQEIAASLKAIREVEEE